MMPQARVLSFGFIALSSFAIAVTGPIAAQSVPQEPALAPGNPVRSVTDPGVVTTRQTITPAGVPSVFQGKVYGVAFGATADELWVLNATHLHRLDWRRNTNLAAIAHNGAPALTGLAFSGRPWLAATSRTRGAALLTTPAKDGNALEPLAENLSRHIAGGLATNGSVAVVPLIADNRVAVLDIRGTGKSALRGTIATQVAPFAAVVSADGATAWVSNWGGRTPAAGDSTAPTGLAENADRVVVNPRGSAATGTVTRLDLKSMKVVTSISAGLHPNGLAWDEGRRRLYVADNNQDTVSVIDTEGNRLLKQFPVQPFAREVAGIAPTAVALQPGTNRLYVTCGGINAVVVMNAESGRVEGMIPTGWYPSSIALSADGKRLAVGALLGVGSGWREEPRKRFVHAYRGSVHVIDLPDAEQLTAWTAAVAANNHMSLAGARIPPPVVNRTPKAVPARAGDASLIQHVVYIVKENRTYDQVFGDMSKGNGDPSLVLFGANVTPNQHRLADQFVLLDNFYASGGNSADGHQWVTQANELAYTLWPGYEGRSYPFDGTDPLAIARGGTLWDAALAARRTVRIYGEYAGRMSEAPARRMELLSRWKQGEDFSSTFHVTAPIASMNGILAHQYPSYSTGIPDVIRARIFLKDLAEWQRAGSMPNLTLLQLPSDHTYGTRPNASSARAMVADNDYAVGQIVEALSRSRFWPHMAVFVVEDDAQDGVDHVDGHRTVALVASPYARRGHVDSTFYSHQSMLKTLELMLGLPSLSLFDLIANDMRASFVDTADATPFEASAPTYDLFEMNPPVKALSGEARRAALASQRMRWDIPDAAPTARLNRILWHSIRGWSTPYPAVRSAVFAPLSLDVDDDDR